MIGSITPLVAGFASLPVAALLLVLGYLVVDAVTGRTRPDAVTKWGLAFPGLVAYGLVLMLIHIATGGILLSSRVAVWVVVGASLLALLAWRSLRARRNEGPRIPIPRAAILSLVILMAAGVLIWGWPAFRILPIAWGGDIDIIHHMGWASEVLNGGTLPSGPLSGDIPNYYPWLYHGLLALVAQFVPSERAYVAMDAMQFLQVTGAVTGLFALGRYVAGRWIGGASTALLGALSGGFGFFVARGTHLISGGQLRSSGVGRFLGDLLSRRSYHLAFENLAPPLPRDVTYALVPAFALLLMMGLKERNRRWLLLAGVLMGMEGLLGAESFIVTFGLSVLVTLLPGTLPRRQVAVSLLLPGLALWSLWVIPLFVHYVEFNGFRNLASAPVSLTFWDILGGWGIATPLAVIGGLLSVRRWREDPPIRVALLLMIAAAAPMLASLVLPVGRGFTTLERDHRYWPIFFLAVVIFGGLGLTELIERARRRRAGLAIVAAVVAVGLALPSPVLGTIAFVRQDVKRPLLTDSLEGDPGTLLNVMGRGRAPLVAVVPRELQPLAAAYTGYRLVAFGTVRRQVRWNSIFGRIGSVRQREFVSTALTSGTLPLDRFRRLVGLYHVDIVVQTRPPPSGFPYCTKHPLQPSGYFVVFVDQPSGCGG